MRRRDPGIIRVVEGVTQHTIARKKGMPYLTHEKRNK